MTRSEILLQVLCLAQSNGFAFRTWFQASVTAEWNGTDNAIVMLTSEG